MRISRKLEELFSSGSDPSVYGPFLSFNFVKCAASVLSSDVGFVEEAVAAGVGQGGDGEEGGDGGGDPGARHGVRACPRQQAGSTLNAGL